MYLKLFEERRSKTPNILQSNSNSFLNGNYNQSSNGYSTSTNGQYQPQLRSKTPTTDRVLFQNSMPNGSSQFETSNDNTMTNNDYIYLTNSTANTMNATNTNGMANGTSKKPQSQHNKLDTLYSTVNKSTRTPVNVSHDECDNLFVEKKTENIENIAPNSTNIKVITNLAHNSLFSIRLPQSVTLLDFSLLCNVVSCPL